MPKFLQYIFIIISYLVIALFIVIITSSIQVGRLQTFLSIYYVYLLELNFFLLLIAFIFNFKYIKEIFAGIGNKYFLLLILISIIGMFTTSFIAPRIHRIYYDEDIYNNVGQCIAEHKRAVVCNEGYYENNELKVIAEGYNKQPQGYPYLISVIFRIFGTNEFFVFILNNIIFGLTVIVIFLISFLLFKNSFASLTACLAYIFIPINLHWFNTCAAEPSTAFFAGMVILASLLYLRNKKPINLFFLTTVLAFSLNFRLESLLIVIVIGLIYLLKDVELFKRKELYIFGALLFLLSTGLILHLYAVRGESWGAAGAKFSLDYFLSNFSANSAFYLKNKEFPLLFSIFGIIGLFFYKNRDYIKEKIILLSWFLAFWGIFLFFYAGSYKFGQDVRFSILSYVPISILVGLGVSFIKTLLGKRIKSINLILILFIIFNFTWFLPFVRAEGEEAWAARTDHRYAIEFAKLLPENSIIFTHNPNIFLLSKRSAIQSSSETYNPGVIEQHLERFKGGVYVHYNYWSNVDDPTSRAFTENILNRYDYEIIKEYHYRNYKYGLYKIIDRKDKK
jgi:hypothetical protein